MRAAGGRAARAADRPLAPIGRPVAAIVLVAIAIAWMLVTLLDLRENGGMAPIIAMFGIPALAASVIVQLVMASLGERRRLPEPVLWWTVVVLPLGILAAFIVALLREPEYFVGDDGPWMLVWVPIFIGLSLLLGAVIWFFFVFPLVSLATVIGRIARREAKVSAVAMPLTLLALGVLCVVGGFSIDADGSGRASWGSIIAAFLGIPGAYDVLWEPGLWIVRGIVGGIVLMFVGPALQRRLRARADDRSGTVQP